jgi:glycerol-3-phosphate acyltransferase PlsX
MPIIAVDVHGGDYAPIEVIKGAISAVEEYPRAEVLLVGVEKLVKPIYNDCRKKHYKQIKLVNAEEIIGMDESPSMAVRRKKNSSIHVGLRLVKGRKADAFFSAGNTGAVMAASKLILGTLAGLDRPAIITVLPNIKGHSVMLDVGANVDCKPLHFIQFAIMGSIYANIVLGIENPKIGLLSIGEEEMKGNDLLKTVYQMLKEIEFLNFRGNVEGKELFKGIVDVVLTDGFAGNIALKVSESTAWYVSNLLRQELSRDIMSKFAALLAKPAFDRVKKRADYTEYGGALLIGVNGISIIGHGSSNAVAIKNGIRVANELVDNKINEKIEKNMLETFEALKADKYAMFWRGIKEKFRNLTGSITEG